MFGSEILDVAIGLILIYLLLSLFAAAVREAVESVLRARAVHLERGIRELLDDPTGQGLARQFYEHPLIYSLYQNGYEAKARRHFGWNMPNYIPSRSFAVALLDLALRGPAVPPAAAAVAANGAGRDDGGTAGDAGHRTAAWPYAAQQTSPGLTEADLRAAVSRLPSVRVQRALLTAIDGARGDLARVQANLEEWFDGTMDRVSGWYKRRTQYGLFLIGLAVTAALNVNTITLANYLARNKAARETLVAHAREVARDSATTAAATPGAPPAQAGDVDRRLRALQALDLPIGWGGHPTAPSFSRAGVTGIAGVLAQAFGLLLTALAITLGAPFWFDMLNKMMVIRSTVKPKEKSPEESSEDRQKPARRGSGDSGGGQPLAAATTAAATTAPATLATASAATLAPAAPAAAAADPGFVPRRWAAGDADEGVL